MRPGRIASFLLAAALLGGQPHAHAQPAATRLVQQYQEAEEALEQALHGSPSDKARAQLADSFFARTGTQDDVTAAQWQSTSGGRPGRSWIVQGLSATPVDDLCIVSFRLINPSTRRAHDVVDIWRISTQKLLQRHQGPLSARPVPDARPTGKG